MGRWLAPAIGVLLLAACGGTTSTAASSIHVVAGENFWGSLVTQLGGAKVRVQSVVTDPNADAHEYESSGNDPPASAVATFQGQISGNQIKVLVYNVQASTAVTTNLKALAASRHIPNVGVTETLQPDNLTFQDWQLKQLQGLEAALKSTS